MSTTEQQQPGTTWNGALAGRSAIVTGAGSGIGRATALSFVGAGARVAFVDRDEGGLRESVRLAGDLDAADGAAVPITVDLTAAGATAKLVDQVVAELGTIDILHNNAGISAPMLFGQHDEETFDRVININLKAVFFLTQRVVDVMLASGRGGSIINTASVAGILAAPYSTAYCASKAGVVGLTRALALELAEHGIRVNAVCPGYFDTPMNQGWLNSYEDPAERQAALDGVTARFLIKRPGNPRELADAVTFLASDAASFCTGVVLPVDGGWSAW